MDAAKFLKERNRMCDSYGSSSCRACQINEARGAMRCYDFQKEYPEQVVDIVEKWSKVHPQKTILQDFLEKYPKALIEDGAFPAACPFQLGYETESEKDKNGYCESTARDSCRRCWNRPLEEE